MTMDEPRRVDLTAAAADVLRRLAGRHGPLMFHQSGGCCDGSSPMCYPDGDPAVAEAAVIAAADELTGQAVVAYVTLGSGVVPEADLETMLREHVGRQIGKLARPGRIIWADDLPKTRSGKIMRRLLRDIAEDREPGDVTTLRDPSVLAQLQRHARTGR